MWKLKIACVNVNRNAIKNKKKSEENLISLVPVYDTINNT